MVNKDALLPHIHAVAARRHLDAEHAREAMRVILRGDATEAQIAGFVTALHMKGETAEELAGFARAMRESATAVPFESAPGEPLLDTCGTGGDGHGTFNISTTAAFVVAGCGVRVAKHGNRAMSSLSGSADVLEQLGVKVAVTPEYAARALREVGVCFLYAPAFHPAMRYVQGVRRELRMRTVFNLLGPLANPAPTDVQIVGTHSADAATRIAAALAELGLERGYVVNGEDGLDEVTLGGSTDVFEIREGVVREFRLTPEEFGLARADADQLQGGDAAENARITLEVLAGVAGPRRDIVIANAALALMAARKRPLRECVGMAQQSIDSGAAREKRRRLAEMK